MTLSLLEWALMIPVVGGSVFAVLCLLASLRFCARPDRPSRAAFAQWPPVTILKPICGLEKNQRDNLRSVCVQDYPEFQVVFSVQDPGDPAIPLLRDIRREFGPDRVSVAIENRQAGCNRKISNLLGGLACARYEILVISDSDMHVKPDYLKTVVSPLADPAVGCVCTLYKAVCADTWFEKLELLTFNADFIPSVIFAHLTGASRFCLGPSLAIRRSTLKHIGGLEVLADYLVEDYELGKRVWATGKKVAIVPYFVDTMVDLKSPVQWWQHQSYWDQNTRAANPGGFFATILVKAVPFAVFFALARLGDGVGLTVLGAALLVRLATAAATLGPLYRDREGVRSLALLPVRDMAALVSWLLAFTTRTVTWRGAEFTLTGDGRLVPKEERRSCESLSSPATTSVSPFR